MVAYVELINRTPESFQESFHDGLDNLLHVTVEFDCSPLRDADILGRPAEERPASSPAPSPATPQIEVQGAPQAEPEPEMETAVTISKTPNPPIISSYSLRSRGVGIAEAMLSALSDHPIPSQYKDAVASPDYRHWKEAMYAEFKALILNNTWTLVPRPPNANVIQMRWVYDLKDENPPRYKSRFVVKGYSQVHGVDYNETYAPVVKAETLRVLFAIAAMMGLECHLMDAITAFLNSDLKDTIYVRPPHVPTTAAPFSECIWLDPWR